MNISDLGEPYANFRSRREHIIPIRDMQGSESHMGFLVGPLVILLSHLLTELHDALWDTIQLLNCREVNTFVPDTATTSS
jgi:hypothetical protein